MLDRNHIFGAIGTFAGVVLVGTLALAWPSYRQARGFDREVADLRGRVESLDASTAEVELLEARLHRTLQKVQEDLKVIPDSPDLAALVRRLSLPVDQDTVIDQTFTAGSPFEITFPGAGKDDDANERPMAMPLSIELAGTFESLFTILTAAESMERLVRVATLRITCDRNEKNNSRPQPALVASVGLEAVFVERAGGRR